MAATTAAKLFGRASTLATVMNKSLQVRPGQGVLWWAICVCLCVQTSGLSAQDMACWPTFSPSQLAASFHAPCPQAYKQKLKSLENKQRGRSSSSQCSSRTGQNGSSGSSGSSSAAGSSRPFHTGSHRGRFGSSSGTPGAGQTRQGVLAADPPPPPARQGSSLSRQNSTGSVGSGSGSAGAAAGGGLSRPGTSSHGPPGLPKGFASHPLMPKAGRRPKPGTSRPQPGSHVAAKSGIPSEATPEASLSSMGGSAAQEGGISSSIGAAGSGPHALEGGLEAMMLARKAQLRSMRGMAFKG